MPNEMSNPDLAALDRAAEYIASGLADPIAEAVAAERRRAAEAVREIVERYRRKATEERAEGNTHFATTEELFSDVAGECLAAVEGKR